RAPVARQAALGDRSSGQGAAAGGEAFVSTAIATMFSQALRRTSVALAAGIALSLAAPAARAMVIERVISPGGIEAWLVRDSAVPLISVDFAFVGGAEQDPKDKPGTANLAASLLDE